MRLQPHPFSQWGTSPRTGAGLWAGQSSPRRKVSAACSAAPVCRVPWVPLDCENTQWWKLWKQVILPYRPCPLSGKACTLHHSYLNLQSMTYLNWSILVFQSTLGKRSQGVFCLGLEGTSRKTHLLQNYRAREKSWDEASVSWPLWCFQ